MSLFRLEHSDIVAYDAIPYCDLRRLHDLWNDLAVGSQIPRIDRLDFRWLSESLSRITLVKVHARGAFEYLYFGRAIVSPIVKTATGRALSDFLDSDHAQMTISHYQEVVDQRRPICRRIVAHYGTGPYEYMRVALPFTTDGTALDRLLVGVELIAAPSELKEAS